MKRINLTDENSKNVENKIEIVRNIIRNNRNLSRRLSALRDAGFQTRVRSCGTGRVGRVMNSRLHGTIMQVSYSWGRYNYAHIVVLN